MTDEPLPAGGSEDNTTRSGMVAIVGRANVGKSTLINTLLDEKISIVSPIAQTTRNMVRAILTEPRGQLVFIDTPGVHKATTPLGQVMNKLARKALDGVDAVMLVVDTSSKPRMEDEGWMKRIARAGLPTIIALNKSDLGGHEMPAYEAIWRTACEKADEPPRVTWLTTSAKKGEGADEILALLFETVPIGPYLFPADVVSDFPRNLLIADMIREKLFASLRQEVPHSVTVLIEGIEEDGDDWHIDAKIYVLKHSQKHIVIGEKGRVLRKAKRAAEREVSEIYHKNVRIDLWVKVEEKWNQNFWFLKRLGYVE